MAGSLREQALSIGRVRALTRVASVENEATLCDLALGVPAGRLGSALAAWLVRTETDAETEARHRRGRGLGWRVEPDAMVAGWFRLAPADAAVFTAVVDASVRRGRCRRDASADAWPSVSQQRADALVALVGAGGAGGVVTEVVFHVHGDGCTLDDGTPIPGSVVERIAPSSFLRVLIHDAQRRPINASGRQRHPTSRQQRVVRERDRCCVDCGSTTLLECDHDPDHRLSGRTVVEELHLRCWACHRARHDRAAGA